MRQVGKTALYTLLAIAMVMPSANAAQDNYEIDLKDLGPARTKAKPQPQPPASQPATGEIDLKELRKIAPPQGVKPTQHKRHSQAAASPEAVTSVESGQESIHVVQPGEHLFQILMKQYGLSDPAAERLIPEVMKLNGISSSKGLKVGQRLRIPLPAKDGKHSVSPPIPAQQQSRLTSVKPQSTAPAPAPVQAPVTALPAQTTVPAKSAIPAPSAIPEAPPVIVSISIVSASPCELARDMAKKMGLLTNSSSNIQGVETVSTTYAGRSVTIACGLSKAEQYTYERLLTHGGKRLLVFEGDEADECVVEKLANGLGLVFRKGNANDEELPITYIFAPFGSWSQEMQLTILPDQEPPAQPDTDRIIPSR